MSKMQLRQSQVVTTFGPGSMVDMPDDSVIIAGLDDWSYDNANIPIVEEPRLVAKLRQVMQNPNLTLRKPPPAVEQDGRTGPNIAGYRFPEWFLVQNEVRIGPTRKRRRLVHYDALIKGKFQDRDRKNHSVVPVRFVRACPKGHVGDIDWKAFVQCSSTQCRRDLWMEESGTSGDLNDIWLVCDCGARRPMAQAARREMRALGYCDGSRPWLGAYTREQCSEPSRLLIRSASNAYFPQQLSVISIPDLQAGIDRVVTTLWDDGLSAVTSAAQLAFIRQIPNLATKLIAYADDELLAAIERVRTGGGGAEGPVKVAEFAALSESREEIGTDAPQGDFYARTLPRSSWDTPVMAGIERVVLVHRLREVVAQLSFTRFEPAAPEVNGDLDIDVQRAPLARDAQWLPAIENRGEGIFLQFRSEAIEEWQAKPAVKTRGRRLLEGFECWKKERAQPDRNFPGLAYCMMHSLSHLLLIAISLECGYPASSLRERIYAAEGAYGILIYTGSSDAEGTLGGLVATGREIGRHLEFALRLGELCSNDPICAHHDPTSQDDRRLAGSACHGCLFISETSCEQRNDYLDRALVTGTIEDCGAEFFGTTP